MEQELMPAAWRWHSPNEVRWSFGAYAPTSNLVVKEPLYAAKDVERMQSALREAERFMAYFSEETGGSFVGPGTPRTCLAQIRGALR